MVTKPPFPSDEKHLAVPSSNTDADKQVSNRTIDSSKQVISPASNDDTSKQVYNESDKQAIPPASTQKELAIPQNDTDKQLTSSLTSPSNTLSLSNAHLTFRVEKLNPLGLIMPQDQKLALHTVHPLTGQDLGPAYVTGEMSWVDVMSVLPPMFDLFRASSGTGLELVGRSVPRGWQGVSGIEVGVECVIGGAEERREKWRVERRGLGRRYKLMGEGEKEVRMVWKGTSSSVKEIVRSGSLSVSGEDKGKKEKVHKGNLKLVDGKEGDGEVFAVWQQVRDSEVLGNLIIFNEAKGKIATEVVIVTCLTAVSAERASGMNWFGGFGK